MGWGGEGSKWGSVGEDRKGEGGRYSRLVCDPRKDQKGLVEREGIKTKNLTTKTLFLLLGVGSRHGLMSVGHVPLPPIILPPVPHILSR